MGVVEHYPALNRPPAPVCSICVANYNGAHMLAECLDSVLAQEAGISVEIIVHDDASTDGSVAFLLERYPQVKVLASRDNVGFCIGNNRMAAHARGEYILLLNNDAALFSDALAALVSDARGRSTPEILTLPQFDWETRELVDRGCLLDPFYNPVPNLDPERQDVAMAIGACLFLPQQLWNDLGGFPEWMESIGEDLYLCCHARLLGLPVRALNSSGYRHRQGASYGGNRIEAGRLRTTYHRRRLSERNKTFALVVFSPTPLVWLFLAIHLVLLALEGSVLAVIRCDRKLMRDVYGNVFTSLFRERRRLWKLRVGIQRSRVATVAGFLSCFTLAPRKLVMMLRHGMPDIS